jgi:hypothetical protein
MAETVFKQKNIFFGEATSVAEAQSLRNTYAISEAAPVVDSFILMQQKTPAAGIVSALNKYYVLISENLGIVDASSATNKYLVAESLALVELVQTVKGTARTQLISDVVPIAEIVSLANKYSIIEAVPIAESYSMKKTSSTTNRTVNGTAVNSTYLG